MLPRSDTEITSLILQERHRHCYRYSVSDTIGRPLLCWPLLFMIWRRIHKRRSRRSTKWDTVDILPPIMPDPVLPCLYCHRPCRTAYLLLSLSSITLTILYMFFCPHSITYFPHLCCCCLSRPAAPPPYPFPSLSAVPIISHFCFR